MDSIRKFLEHPLTKGIDIDDPLLTQLRKEVIKAKPFLNKIYHEWYSLLLNQESSQKTILELGSGGGFIKEYSNKVITSDVLQIQGIDLVATAHSLPFAENTFDGIILTNVFHHIPQVEKFLLEANRCLNRGGKITMIEPWPNFWSRFMYKYLHAEPFNEKGSWELSGDGPLSSANGALPWIVFERDRLIFEQKFPHLTIIKISSLMPLIYLLSGGVGFRNFLPGWSYNFFRLLDRIFNLFKTGMFSLIVIQKR